MQITKFSKSNIALIVLGIAVAWLMLSDPSGVDDSAVLADAETEQVSSSSDVASSDVQNADGKSQVASAAESEAKPTEDKPIVAKTPEAKSVEAKSQKSPEQKSPDTQNVASSAPAVVPDEDDSVVDKISGAANAVVSVLKFKTDNFQPSEEIDVPIRGNLRVEVLDEKTICLVGDYHKFLCDRFTEECGAFMRGIENPAAKLKPWSIDVFYDVMAADIILKYRPVISKAYWNFSEFKVWSVAPSEATSKASEKVSSDKNNPQILTPLTVENGGYWINGMGQAFFPDASTGKPRSTQNAQVGHFAYLILGTPLENGKEYEIQNPLGEKISFKYSDSDTISGAIKVNQVGYSPEARRKYAYVGAWLGTAGALDLSEFVGKPFEIINEKTGGVAYEGVLSRRDVEDATYASGAKFTGEDVLEANFSDFKGDDGAYHIRIAGIGRSYSFEISNDAIGEAFYIHMKGLYHKRCGIAKKSPYTKWHMGKCHTTLYKSSFPPNDRHYSVGKKSADYGFFNKNGEHIRVSHFRFISVLEPLATRIDGECVGGWHDAADYDRRPYHMSVVCDLLSTYLLRPQNFADSQLNIPESGNGIPDILDEAEWGMRIWLRLQNADGSAGGWIEATSHPKDPNPSSDTQKYFVSASTRETSEEYAAHASMLALAYRNAGLNEKSMLYTDSAIRAHAYATNPANRFIKTYNYPELPAKGKENVPPPPRKITYSDSSKVAYEPSFKASFNLWLLTGESKYAEECEALAPKMPQCFADTNWKTSPLFFTEFLKYGDVEPFKKLYKVFKKHIVANADVRLDWLNSAYQYRISWYPPKHHYVSTMSWGNFHPAKAARFFIAANEITGNQKYRDAAFLCNDFHNGANAWGQSFTSGLGKNYPVKFLDLISLSDGIPEYVQGITPYRNTFGIPRDGIRLAQGLYYRARPDRSFAPKPVNVLPPSITGEGVPTLEEFAFIMRGLWPIWHRFSNVEGLTVAASEYTINETMSSPAAMAGWLMEPNWVPSERLKNVEPALDITKLHGYNPLP